MPLDNFIMWHYTNNDDFDLLWQTQHSNMKVTKSARYPPHSVTNKTTDFFHILICFAVCLFVITGLSLTAMWTCIAHTGYFLVCAVLLTFLRCPAFSRAILLLSVPLNAVAEVNQQPALDLTGLSLLLLTLSLGTKLRFLSHKLCCFQLLSCICHFLIFLFYV